MQRRDFLRTLALGGAAILAGGSALGANAQPAPPGGYPAPGGRPPPPPAAGRRAPRPRAAAAAARSPPAAAARSRLCLGRWLLGLARWPLCVGAGTLDRGAARAPLELGTMAPAGAELGVRAGRLALIRQGTAPCAMRNTLYI